CLIQLTKLGYDATPFNQILKQNAKREMRLRLGKVTVADVLAAQPVTTNLLKFMRASIKMIGVSNLQSFIASGQAHADGWFIVFDTLTLADDRLEAFYDNPNALRDYFRDIGRMVLAAEGRKANDSHAD